jgi:uncharacterized protein YcbX
MTGRLASLYRHPVKGFTPERRAGALLEAGATFPCDRLYAVENGPSGFDPAAPAFVPKTRFTVLASIPALARAETRYDEATGVFSVRAPGRPDLGACLEAPEGREAFAAWLSGFIDEEQQAGPLRVLKSPGPHRFTDDRAGAVSMINLASLRELSDRLGRPVDPRRFRANLHVDGWEPWAELDLAPGAEVQVGEATLRVVKPIVRCAATHVHPETGERDLELVPGLHAHYGRMTCGIYLQVAWGGRVAEGDAVQALAPALIPPSPVEIPVRRV